MIPQLKYACLCFVGPIVICKFELSARTFWAVSKHMFATWKENLSTRHENEEKLRGLRDLYVREREERKWMTIGSNCDVCLCGVALGMGRGKVFLGRKGSCNLFDVGAENYSDVFLWWCAVLCWVIHTQGATCLGKMVINRASFSMSIAQDWRR